MANVYLWANTSPEEREAANQEREFQKWAKTVKAGWSPTATDLTQPTMKK